MHTNTIKKVHNLISKKVSSLSREKNTLWHSFLQDKVSSPRAFCSVQFSQYGPFPLTNYLLLTRVICHMRNKYWRYFHFIKIVLPLNPLHSATYSSCALCKNKIFNLKYRFTYLSPMGTIRRFGCTMILKTYKHNQNAAESSFY